MIWFLSFCYASIREVVTAEPFQHVVTSSAEVWDSSSQSVQRNAEPIRKKQSTRRPSFMEGTDTEYRDACTEMVEIGVCLQGFLKILIMMWIIFLCLWAFFFFNVFVTSLMCWAHMFLARSSLVAEPRRNERHRALRKHRRQHFENPPTPQPKSMCHICWLIRRMNKQENSLFLCVIKCTLCQFLFCCFFSSGALRNGNTHCEPWTFLCTLYDWTQDRPKVEQKDHRILLRRE